jgi:RNA polymerase sigma-70 factor, ECF subfamily
MVQVMVESNEDRRRIDAALRQQLTVAWTKALPSVSAFVSSSVRDFHKAEDLVQEVAATVAEKFEEYDASRPFVNWALGIAQNKVLGLFRKEATRRLMFDDATVESLAVATADVASDLDVRERALKQCLQVLPERARKLLEARYRSDEPVAAIAKKMGMTANTVYVALHRVRASLRGCIERRMAAHAR